MSKAHVPARTVTLLYWNASLFAQYSRSCVARNLATIPDRDEAMARMTGQEGPCTFREGIRDECLGRIPYKRAPSEECSRRLLSVTLQGQPAKVCCAEWSPDGHSLLIAATETIHIIVEYEEDQAKQMIDT